MVAGSTVTADGEKLTSTLTDYEGKVTSLDSSWKGDSYTSFNSQVTSFVSEYKPIADQLSTFGSACDNYKTYEEKRNLLKQKEAELETELAKPEDEQDSAYIQSLNDEITQLKGDIETLKTQITSDLTTAGSLKLEATALSDSSATGATGASGDTATTTDAAAAGASSEYAVTPHSGISEEERAARVAMVGGECGSQAEQDSKMSTIEVPYWDGTQEQTMKLTVNSNLTSNYQNVFRQLADMHWTVDPNRTGAYDYNHTPRPSGAPSDHTLGSAIDINWDNNWNTGDGSSAAVRGNEQVINAFASQGFYWGGDWSHPDDMHFSFTGY